MQKFIGTGRLTADPTTRYSNGDKPCCFAKYTIAINRRFKREGEPDADFIQCSSFGKTAEFVEKYFTKGMKIEVCGEIRTGKYTNKDGVVVFTTEVAVEEVGFAESKGNNSGPGERPTPGQASCGDGFVNIDQSNIEEELPFN